MDRYVPLPTVYYLFLSTYLPAEYYKKHTKNMFIGLQIYKPTIL